MSATSLQLDTPAQSSAGSSIVFTGTYTGDPTTLQYDLGSGWVTASDVDFADGVFSFSLPGNVGAGTYTPQVRDGIDPDITSAAGAMVVSSWSPQSLISSPGAHAIFEFSAGNASEVPVSGNEVVGNVYNSLDSSEYLTAKSATDGNPVLIGDRSGADGTRRVLTFTTTTESPNSYDPSTNWLSAGGVDGTAGSALVDLANSSDLATQGTFTAVIGLDIDSTASYQAGPIWGSLASPGPLQYVQLRINRDTDSQGADLTDRNDLAANAQGPITAGWHVVTIIKANGTLTYRLDGKTVQSTTITLNQAFAAADFLIGGGFPQGSGDDLGEENGVPPGAVAEFQAYQGALSGSDLANAEALAANAIGTSLNGEIASGSQNVYLEDAPSSYAARAYDTVHGSAGAATVTASQGLVTMIGNSGPLTFVGGSAPSTVNGGSGSDTVLGSTGGGVYQAGTAGDAILAAGGGNTTLTGAGNGDRLFGASNGQNVLIAGAGAETLVGGGGGTTFAGGSSGTCVIFGGSGSTSVVGGAVSGDTIVGGSGSLSVSAENGDAVFGGTASTVVQGSLSGADSIIGGQGDLSVTGNGANMLVAASAQSSQITTGSGASLIFAENGATDVTAASGSLQLVLGAGSGTITEGSGAATFDVVKGEAGGSYVINGFRPGTDQIDLFGYDADDLTVASSAGSSTINLTDGTRINLIGVTDPGSSVVG